MVGAGQNQRSYPPGVQELGIDYRKITSKNLLYFKVAALSTGLMNSWLSLLFFNRCEAEIHEINLTKRDFEKDAWMLIKCQYVYLESFTCLYFLLFCNYYYVL